MIRREDVADLRVGDVVEVSFDNGYIVRGPVVESYGCLELGPHGVLRFDDGDVPLGAKRRTLTVISRAPAPLYVNHDRTEPVVGDVVRDADSDDVRSWTKNCSGFSHEWLNNKVHVYQSREGLPDRLRLLVDGETGQVVR